MKIEYLKSSWFAALVVVAVSVGLSGCCSNGCGLGKCGLLGKRGAVDHECATVSSAQGALEQYQGEVVTGSATRTADASLGSATKNCGTG